MVNAISKELTIRSSELNQEIDTIYLGGGTPSLLKVNELNILKKVIDENYKLKSSLEFTIEINPEDVSMEKVKQWKSVGINRYSLGVQSFHDSELVWMNRKHSAENALSAISLLQEYGSNNISIDLIYGIPGSTLNSWQINVQKALSLNIPHISAYMLTIEPATSLFKKLEQNKLVELEEDIIISQFDYLIREFEQHGYEHYEISSFCLKDQRSKHNTSYWLGEDYLGVGPSAHSYSSQDIFIRRWNVANNHKYIKAIEAGENYFEKEELKLKDRYNEYIMTSLRTWRGINLIELENYFGSDLLFYFESEISKQIEAKLLFKKKDNYHLTNKGKFVADRIISDLFML
jgi:oxygen-independent coproporphyrinogen-3 oxidase